MSTQAEHDRPGARACAEPLCTECGTPPGAVPLRRPWWARWRSILAVAALFIAAALIGLKNWEAWPVPPAGGTPGAGNVQPGITAGYLPMQPVTRAEVVAIAEGSDYASTVPLIAQIADLLRNPHEELSAAFLSAHGTRTELHSWGWPATIFMTRWSGVFENVYSPGDSLAPYTPRDPVWSYGSYFRFRTDARGRDGRSMIGFPMLLSYIVLLAGAWWIGAVMRQGARRLFPRLRPWDPPRLARRLPIITLVLAAATMAILSARPRDDSFMNPVPLVPPELTRIGVTTCEASELARRPDGDAQLARVILDTLDPQSDGYLAFALYRLAPVMRERASGGWPAGTVSYARDETPLPPTENRRARWRLRWESTRIELETTRPGTGGAGGEMGSSTVVTRWSLSDWRLGQILLILLAAWWSGRALPAAAGLIEKRRARRWHAHGHCLYCGYDLRGGGRGAPAIQPSSKART